MELVREQDAVHGTADIANTSAATNTPPAAQGSTELPNLRHESERLKLERDNAQLRAELAATTRPAAPWWRKGTIVTTLTAIIAAVIPVTTAVQAHYEKERELAMQAAKQAHEIELESSKQAHEIRTSYLDRLEKPGAKLRTLRFVLATTTDPEMKAWAEGEKKVVEGELAKVDGEIADLQAQETRLHEKEIKLQARSYDQRLNAELQRVRAELQRVRERGEIYMVQRPSMRTDEGLDRPRSDADADAGQPAPPEP